MGHVLRESMVDEYLTRGYLVFEGIVPPVLLRELVVRADGHVVPDADRLSGGGHQEREPEGPHERA